MSEVATPGGEVTDAGSRQQALDPLQSFCVTAPAGSGKTELLIQRCLTLLARVTQPEEVLAITFTRKAAAEMRARIVAALETANDLADSDTADSDATNSGIANNADAHSQHTSRLAAAVMAVSEERGWQLLHTPTRLNIKTIDGFCASLTRQMPVLSSFGGPAQPVDDAAQYYEEAIRALLELLEAGHPLAADLSRVMLHFDNNWQRVEGLLVSMLARRDQWLQHIGVSVQSELAARTLRHTLEDLVADSLQPVADVLAGYAGELLDCYNYASGNLQAPLLDELPGLDHTDLPAWRSLVALLLTAQDDWRKNVTVTQGFPPGEGEHKAAAKAMKDSMKALLVALREEPGLLVKLAEIRSLPALSTDTEHWQLLMCLCRVLPLAAAQLSVVFQQHGIVDHAQVAMAARAALGEDDSPTDLALKLDYQLQHILMDEFQDTSTTQFELVRRLTRGWAETNQANPGNPRTLLIVGDGMQSIYGFRDADVGLFMRAKQHGFNGLCLTPLELNTNFRSDAALVEWVNHSFRDGFPALDNVRRGEISFSPSMPYRQQAQARSPAGQQAVSMLAIRGADYQAQATEASSIATVIEQGLADQGCASIAVLVRSRGHLTPIIAALKARGIVWQAQDIDLLAASPVVIDLMTLCRALYNLADDVAWLGLLRAPCCGLYLDDLWHVAHGRQQATIWQQLQDEALPAKLSEDGAQRLQAFMQVMRHGLAQRERLPLRNWVEGIWLQLGGPAVAAKDSQLADAGEFLDLLEAMDNAGENYNPTVLERRVRRLYSAPPAVECKLQLMTLHRAKGLEFDWVIIPGLSRVPRSDSRDIMLWDEYSGDSGRAGFLLAMDEPENRACNTVYNYLHRQRKLKSDLETTRLLYVGCTRAIQRLYLTATLQVNEDDDDDELRSPAPSSMLQRIWPVFAESCQLVAAPTTAVQLEHGNGSGFRRLARLAAAAGAASSPVAEAVPAAPADNNIPEPWHNALHRTVGTVIHLSLQRLSCHSEAELAALAPAHFTDWWSGQLRKAGFTGDTLQQALARVEQSVAGVLADATGRWLLANDRDAAESEYALSMLRADGRVAEYFIDRTFLHDDVRWIVDYKSSVPQPGEAREDFLAREAQRHSEQLRRYREVFTLLESRTVKTALYFTALPVLLETN